MGKFLKSSIFLRISLPVSLLACLLEVIGIASPNWMSYYSRFKFEIRSGLWEGILCYEGRCTIHEYEHDEVEGWLKSVIALEVLGLLVSVAALVLIVLTIFHSDDSKKGKLKKQSIVACFAAGLLIILGVIIFIARQKINYNAATEVVKTIKAPDPDTTDEVSEAVREFLAKAFIDLLSWAIWLCTTSAILSFMCGILVILSYVM